MNKVFLDLTNRVVDILNDKKTNLHFQLIEDAEHAYLFFREKRVPAILSYLFSEIDKKTEVAL